MTTSDGALDESAAVRRALVDALVARHAQEAARSLAALYATVDPDEAAQEIDDDARARVVSALDEALDLAGYRALDDDEVRGSVRAEGIFPLSYDVDFSRLAFVRVWAKGERERETTRPTWGGLRRESVRFRAYSSVLVALAFRPRVPTLLERLRARLLPPTVRHEVAPGRLSLRLVRDVPKADLEIVFPDPRPRMKNAQVATIAVPFVSGVGILMWEWIVRPLVDGGRAAALSDAALTAVAVALAGHAYKTWQGHRAAVREFVNEVTRSLYFRSVAVNAGVPSVVAHEGARALADAARVVDEALARAPDAGAQGGVDARDDARALPALVSLGVVLRRDDGALVRAPLARLRALLDS